MTTLKTMRVELRACERTEFGFKLRLNVGSVSPGVHNYEFEVSTPDEMEAKLTELVTIPTPEYGTETFPCNAWRISVEPASGRWAPGWKARFDAARYVRYDEIGATA